MKRILNTLTCFAVLLTAFSCQQELIVDVSVNESIILDLSSGLTKADDTDTESYIDHIDVFIFAVSGSTPGQCVVHEHFTVNNTPTVTLEAKRTDFPENAEYYVYLIANSTQDLSGIASYSELHDMMQEDINLHLTGLTIDVAPKYFLMDGIAKDGNGNSPVVLYNGRPQDDTELFATLKRAAAKVVINVTAGDAVTFMPYGTAEGSEGGLYYVRNLPYDTYLLAETLPASEILYAKLTTTGKTNSGHFLWDPTTEEGKKKVTLTTYVYPHCWVGQSILDKETCVVMNLPMDYKKDAGSVAEPFHNSWYKIPMTDNQTFERNNYYEVNITVNRPGAIVESEPTVLEEIFYAVGEWTTVDINISDASRPSYLQLNTDHVDMYNVNIDNKSLSYASSSPVSIELVKAYYVNYLDQEVDVTTSAITASPIDGSALNGGVTINSPFVGKTDAEIAAEIAALGSAPSVRDEPVNPEVQAPDPQEIVNRYNQGQYEYRRITYSGSGANVVFRAVSNSSSTGRQNAQLAQNEYDAAYQAYIEWSSLTAQEQAEKIQQYQDELALYNTEVAALNAYNQSVREILDSDEDSHNNAIRYMEFKVTNQEGDTAYFTVHQYPTIYISNRRGAYSYRSDFNGTNYETEGDRAGANWDNGRWDYGRTSSGSYFFGSKVALGSEGNYTINYAYWDDGEIVTPEIGTLNNPRMYHVHVTATSSTYIVARPRLDANGYTESSADNTKLVSPSFMIASQLGATLSPDGGVNQAKSHCEQYIEVGVDGQVYDDWRLPTAAEIDIIIQHQDISDAMAVVLSGSAYYCAYNTDRNGNVIYTKATGKSGTQNAVRCIRDVY
ncbi:MAG: hypothetical protein J5990_01440 [Bacteroidales bacterium]|nr:hypothetical protein [Bacteroidales bacterium]